ncbi:MAG: hypothetical protein WC734_00300 [Patescibacteria group bacterium]|jgi:hypothetical protein
MNDSIYHPDNHGDEKATPNGQSSKTQKIGRHIIRLLLPPVAHVRHRHYAHRHPAHLWLDTLLALVIFALAGWNIFHITSRETLPAPKLDVTITADRTIDQIGPYQITAVIRNDSDTAVTGVAWQQYHPVIGGDTEQSQTDVQPIWTIGQLTPGQEARRTYDLIVMGSIANRGTINGLLSFYSGNQNFTQTGKLSYAISRPALNVSISGADTVQSGVAYNIRAEIENISGQSIAKPILAVTLPVGTKLISAQPDVESDGLTWEWSELPSGSKQSVTLTVTSDRLVSSELLASAQAYAGQAAKRLIQSEGKFNWRVVPPPTIETVISHPAETKPSVTLVAEARYYGTTGVQLGYGPIPPKVGQLTGYRIFWLISNTGPTVNGIRLTAVLPNEVSWIGNAANSIGQSVRYDSTRREVSWTLDEFPSDAQMATASFEIMVTPASLWAGRVMPLLNVTTLTGKYRSGMPVKVTVSGLTTDLIGDQDPAHGRVSK